MTPRIWLMRITSFYINQKPTNNHEKQIEIPQQS